MSDLPLTYFQLNATYQGIVGDTGDPGLSPDFFTVNMDLTLNGRVEGAGADEQLLLTNLTPPVTALMVPVPASIQNGVLVLPRQLAPSTEVNDPTQSAIPGLRLVAKSSLLNIGESRLLYDVQPGTATIYGKSYRFDPFTFAAPTVEPPMPYTLTIVGTPTAGTFAVRVVALGVTGITTALAFNATAATVQAALVALGNVGSGNVVVTGPAGGPYALTFGGALTGQPVALSGDGTLLTGGTNEAVIADAVVSAMLDLTTVARVVDAPL
jgi:hypothetical protein